MVVLGCNIYMGGSVRESYLIAIFITFYHPQLWDVNPNLSYVMGDRIQNKAGGRSGTLHIWCLGALAALVVYLEGLT